MIYDPTEPRAGAQRENVLAPQLMLDGDKAIGRRFVHLSRPLFVYCDFAAPGFLLKLGPL